MAVGGNSGSPEVSTPSGQKLRTAISEEVAFLLRVGMLIKGALSALQRSKAKTWPLSCLETQLRGQGGGARE